jgi:hypothetical protein
MTPFDIVNTINMKSEHDRDEVVADYVPFVINRALSYTMDSSLFAAEMSMYSHLDYDMQFDFYHNGLPKGKRFGKWSKPDDSNETLINILSEALCINNRLAKRYLTLLSEEEKQNLLEYEGGKS